MQEFDSPVKKAYNINACVLKYKIVKGYIMTAIIQVIKEQIKHFRLIYRLSMYELRSNNKSNYLGIAWEFINPLVQILIYWFVFGYGIRSRADIVMESGLVIPFLPWMVIGYALWTFFYQSTIQGSKSIYTRLKMLSKMNFPLSIIPNIPIFSQMFIHFFMLGVVLIVLMIFDISLTIYVVQVVYFLFATVVFCYAISLITSTLSTIIRDVHMFINSTLRMLLYLSPILWNTDGADLGSGIQLAMKLNPMHYLIEGYRAGFLGINWYMIENWQFTIYFWTLTFIIMLLGSLLHVRFRRHLIDFL